MNNIKFLLMDFYLKLLTLSKDDDFKYQWLADCARDALADELKTTRANVEMIFNRMVAEDEKL